MFKEYANVVIFYNFSKKNVVFCQMAGKWRNDREKGKAETLILSDFSPFIA